MNRSFAAQNLVDCAILSFADFGYEAASLSDIAERAGIKKPSIYAHFANKDALFMAAFDESLEKEKALIKKSFASEMPNDLPGFLYCENSILHFENDLAARFLLRTGFLSPAHLIEQVSERYQEYIAFLKGEYKKSLLNSNVYKVNENNFAPLWEFFLAVLDSVQVKLMYTTPDESRKRLNALRYFFAFALGPFRKS